MMAHTDTPAHGAGGEQFQPAGPVRRSTPQQAPRRGRRQRPDPIVRRATRPGEMVLESPAKLPAAVVAERNAAALRYLTRTGNLDVADALGLVDQVDAYGDAA